MRFDTLRRSGRMLDSFPPPMPGSRCQLTFSEITSTPPSQPPRPPQPTCYACAAPRLSDRAMPSTNHLIESQFLGPVSLVGCDRRSRYQRPLALPLLQLGPPQSCGTPGRQSPSARGSMCLVALLQSSAPRGTLSCPGVSFNASPPFALLTSQLRALKPPTWTRAPASQTGSSKHERNSLESRA